MIKKALHILFISILALNLTGAWVFASALDCGMECCDNGGQADSAFFKASSCCQLSDVTCGFGSGHHRELFDKAICHHAGNQKAPIKWSPNTTQSIFSTSPNPLFVHSDRNTGPPPKTAVYLSNATILC